MNSQVKTFLTCIYCYCEDHLSSPDNLTDSLDTMNLTDTKNLIDTMETFPQEIDACQLSTAKAEAGKIANHLINVSK